LQPEIGLNEKINISSTNKCVKVEGLNAGWTDVRKKVTLELIYDANKKANFN
jgi:hypothetical protein